MIDYDDSDGWYDHQMGPIIRQSQDAADALTGPGKCGSAATPPAQNDRCGVGPRTPLLVISPYAKQNFVDNTFTEQASIPRFIEDNWNLGRIGNGSADASAGTLMNAFQFTGSKRAPAIIMDPNTGEVVKTIPSGGSGSSTSGAGSGSSATSSSTQSSGSSSSSLSAAAEKAAVVSSVKFSCHQSAKGFSITLSCSTGSKAKSPAVVRARLYHGKKLVRNVASRMHQHRVKLTMRLRTNAARGRYTTRVSVDAGGSVAAWTRSMRIG